MKQGKLRIFECVPYEITMDSGKKYKITDKIYVGNLSRNGSFSGAVFSDGAHEGSVTFDAKTAKERLGRELFLKEAV